MCVYMAAGAGIFMVLEADNERVERADYEQLYRKFMDSNPAVNESQLQELLQRHALADAAGIVGDKRPRWDFSGSFYFVGTVVSTIGKYNSFAFSIFPCDVCLCNVTYVDKSCFSLLEFIFGSQYMTIL